MDLGKRCLRCALPPTNAGRGHGGGPSRKPENLGPTGDVPARLGGEEGADRARGRTRRRGEDDPSPRHRVSFGDQHLFSTRSVSEPEKGPGTVAEGIENPSGACDGTRWQGRAIRPRSGRSAPGIDEFGRVEATDVVAGSLRQSHLRQGQNESNVRFRLRARKLPAPG